MGLFDIFNKKTTTAQAKTYICARCKKEITDNESKWIGNHRFCVDCAAPPQNTTIEAHLKAEAKEAEYQAHMDYQRGSLTPEQAYSNRGFVKNEDGDWVYEELVSKDMKLLEDMIKQIIADCIALGVPEYRIKHFKKNYLCPNPVKCGDYMLFSYNLNGNDGYSITNWERGRCNWGFGSKDAENFRFLFQLKIVNDFYSYNLSLAIKQRAEEFMEKVKPLFGNCEEYKKAEMAFAKSWPDFSIAKN